jgi:hypothetical protein
MRNRHLLPAVVLLLASCSSSRSTSGPDSTAVSTTGAAVTTAAPDTSVSPSSTDTTLVDTTVPATGGPCAAAGDTAAKGSTDPLAMSGKVGADIRVGDHPCFERVVIELAGPGDFPGWAAEYVDDPVRLGESDEFTEIDGNATLLVRMGMWMPTMEGDGYNGPIDIFPTAVEHIAELRQTENWEGINIWAIGVDDEYPFTVTVLGSPARLVIDFQVAE